MLWTLQNDSLHNIPPLFKCFPTPFAVSPLPLVLFPCFLHLLFRWFLSRSAILWTGSYVNYPNPSAIYDRLWLMLSYLVGMLVSQPPPTKYDRSATVQTASFVNSLSVAVPPPTPRCEYYPYPYSLHLHRHQRTHFCEALRSQHYTKGSRNTPLSWYCYGIEYSQCFLILCRFAPREWQDDTHSITCAACPPARTSGAYHFGLWVAS
jgi:hypothetical protein